MSHFKLKYASLIFASSFIFGVHTANAAAVLVYNDTLLGVNDEGHLNYSPTSDEIAMLMDGGFIDGFPLNSVIGLYRDNVGDATSPGCLCEGWGVSAVVAGTPISAGANEDSGGAFNIDGGTFGNTLQTATSVVNFSDADISVTHSFGPSLAQGVFQGQVTISNNTGMDIDDVVYRRAMDWDVPPTEFSEYVTHQGVEANLVSAGGNVKYASDNGFATWDPLEDAGAINDETINVDFIDNGPDDHGSVFDFSFGTIAADESRIFNIFYGSSADEAEALAAVSTLGIDVFSLGQQTFAPDVGAPATFLFGFGGVGGVEPGSTASVPILPFVPAPGEFVFTTPEPGNWYDPPFAEGFVYSLVGGATFSDIETPGAAFGFGDVEIYVGGALIATVAEGSMFDLTSLATDTFELLFTSGITLDVAAPGFATAFPLFLDWDGMATALTMSSIITSAPPTSVSSPSGMLILLLTSFGIFVFRRR